MERRVVLKLGDGTSLLTANPFRVADELRQLVGEIEGAKPSASGALVIQAATQEQVDVLVNTRTFMGKPASFDAPGSTVEAFAYAPSLSGVSDEEILSGLADQGVVGVTRLRKRKDGSNHPGIRLRFRGGTFPPTIRAGFEDFELRAWQRSPLLCRRCASFGHVQKHCRAATKCCLRCAENHATDDCKSETQRCPHCNEGHAAWDRRCGALAAYAAKQGWPTQSRPAAVVQKASKDTQTFWARRDAETKTAKTATTSRGCGTGTPPTTSIEVQTDHLPTFVGPLEPIEEVSIEEQRPKIDYSRRLRHRTPQQAVAAVPPTAPVQKEAEAQESGRAFNTGWWPPPPEPTPSPPTPPPRANSRDWWHQK